MIKLEFSADLERISNLLDQENLAHEMCQFSDKKFTIPNNALCFIVSDEIDDCGIFIAEPMSYIGHFTIHVGFLPRARGFTAFCGSRLFVDSMKELFDYGTLYAMNPSTKPGATRMALRAGFEFITTIPKVIMTEKGLVDQDLCVLRWTKQTDSEV